MGSVAWIGVTTNRRYEFTQQTIPAALISPISQQPLQKATYNGETIVMANHDGSVARAVATGPPQGANKNPQPQTKPGNGVNDIYSAYTNASLFEQS